MSDPPKPDSSTEGTNSASQSQSAEATTTLPNPTSTAPGPSSTPRPVPEFQPNPITCTRSLIDLIRPSNTLNNNANIHEHTVALAHIATPLRGRTGFSAFSKAKVYPYPFRRNSSRLEATTNPEEPIQEELCLLKTVLPLDASTEFLQNNNECNMQCTLVSPEDIQGHGSKCSSLGSKKNGTGAIATESSTRVIKCSDSDSMEGFCRICHDNPSKMTLIAPCSCKGSMGLVHRQCLERWLGESGKQTCEICNYEFITERRPRYTGITSVYQWMKSPTTPADTRNLFFDLACFFILTPLAAISSWLCIVGARQYGAMKTVTMQEPGGNHAAGGAGSGHSKDYWRQNDPTNSTWTSVGLLTLTGTLLGAYYVWLFVAIRYHIQVYRTWKSHNFIVTIMPAVIRNPNNEELNLTDVNNTNSASGINCESSNGNNPNLTTEGGGGGSRSRSLSLSRTRRKSFQPTRESNELITVAEFLRGHHQHQHTRNILVHSPDCDRILGRYRTDGWSIRSLSDIFDGQDTSNNTSTDSSVLSSPSPKSSELIDASPTSSSPPSIFFCENEKEKTRIITNEDDNPSPATELALTSTLVEHVHKVVEGTNSNDSRNESPDCTNANANNQIGRSAADVLQQDQLEDEDEPDKSDAETANASGEVESDPENVD